MANKNEGGGSGPIDPNLAEIQRLDAEVARLRNVMRDIRIRLEDAGMQDSATLLAFTVGQCIRAIDDGLAVEAVPS